MTPRHRTSNEKFEIVMIVFGAFVFVLGDILFLLIDDDDGQLEKKLVSYLRTKILGVGEGSNIIEHYPVLYALLRSKVSYKFETE